MISLSCKTNHQFCFDLKKNHTNNLANEILNTVLAIHKHTHTNEHKPNRNMKVETRKAKAPSPPSAKPTDSTSKANDKYYLQLNGDDDKLFTNETSYC